MVDKTRDFFEQDLENEDDLSPRTAKIISGVVVSDTDWTAETILSQLRKDNIRLNPRFQRRETWTDQRKSRFIESLILGLPVPQLVLAELPESKGRYLVIDGKQRLLTLHRFALDKDNPLVLKDLQYRKDLNGLQFGDIASGRSAAKDLSAFDNAPVRTTIVRNWRDEEVLYLIFYRLNSGSVPLSPQELRHVLRPGPFMDFAFDFTENSDVLIHLLGRDGKPDFRMRDVEMLIRFLGFRYFLHRYDGNLKEFLDSTASSLNKSWSEDEGRVKRAAKRCEEAITTTQEIFGEEAAFAKWTEGGPETRFNRAVFDVMCFYFSHRDVAKQAVEHKAKIVKAFSRLCLENSDFLRSIEATTKSVQATQTRLALWGETLDDIVDVPEELKDKVESIGA